MGDLPGHLLPDYALPAAMIVVDENKDLGGWVPLAADELHEADGTPGGVRLGAVERRFRDGKLTRNVESFDWMDDVDLEGLCDVCNSPIQYGGSLS